MRNFGRAGFYSNPCEEELESLLSTEKRAAPESSGKLVFGAFAIAEIP